MYKHLTLLCFIFLYHPIASASASDNLKLNEIEKSLKINKYKIKTQKNNLVEHKKTIDELESKIDENEKNIHQQSFAVNHSVDKVSEIEKYVTSYGNVVSNLVTWVMGILALLTAGGMFTVYNTNKRIRSQHEEEMKKVSQIRKDAEERVRDEVNKMIDESKKEFSTHQKYMHLREIVFSDSFTEDEVYEAIRHLSVSPKKDFLPVFGKLKAHIAGGKITFSQEIITAVDSFIDSLKK